MCIYLNIKPCSLGSFVMFAIMFVRVAISRSLFLRDHALLEDVSSASPWPSFNLAHRRCPKSVCWSGDWIHGRSQIEGAEWERRVQGSLAGMSKSLWPLL